METEEDAFNALMQKAGKQKTKKMTTKTTDRLGMERVTERHLRSTWKDV